MNKPRILSRGELRRVERVVSAHERTAKQNRLPALKKEYRPPFDSNGSSGSNGGGGSGGEIADSSVCCSDIFERGSVSLLGLMWATDFSVSLPDPIGEVVLTHQSGGTWESDLIDVTCADGTDEYKVVLVVSSLDPGDAVLTVSLESGGGYDGEAECCEFTHKYANPDLITNPLAGWRMRNSQSGQSGLSCQTPSCETCILPSLNTTSAANCSDVYHNSDDGVYYKESDPPEGSVLVYDSIDFPSQYSVSFDIPVDDISGSHCPWDLLISECSLDEPVIMQTGLSDERSFGCGLDSGEVNAGCWPLAGSISFSVTLSLCDTFRSNPFVEEEGLLQNDDIHWGIITVSWTYDSQQNKVYYYLFKDGSGTIDSKAPLRGTLLTDNGGSGSPSVSDSYGGGVNIDDLVPETLTLYPVI